jgi:DNA polymerase-1
MVVAVDIETYDPNIDTLGSGSIRGDGTVLVAGLYDGHEYHACRPGTPSWDKLRDILADETVTKVAHNGVYDYDWLQNGLGLHINGRMEDTMTRAGLLNEYAGRYDLDACCLREGVEGKNKADTLDAWWAQQGGHGVAIRNLVMFPASIVDKYNAQDCKATYDLYMAQQPKLKELDLLGANDIEVGQYPVILAMRKNGIRISAHKIAALRERIAAEIDEDMRRLASEYGITSLSRRTGEGALPVVLKQMGLHKDMDCTSTGDISVSVDSLMSCPHPVAAEVIDIKRKQTLYDKYLNSVFVKFPIGDRIHGTFKPTQRDEGGTITGRYASSDPNMQNFSAREDKNGPLVRGLFIPDEACWLGKLDYSQIEYRVLAHYAVGPGSTQLRENYAIPGTDYHNMSLELLGWPKAMRRICKNFNFGMIYGMGKATMKRKFKHEIHAAASGMGMTTDQYIDKYHNEYLQRMSFIKPTTMAIQSMAQRQNYVRSIGGRIHRAPPDEQWYKMTNYLIQGSAADINKIALRNAHQAGIFDVLRPHLTVHDEVVVSVPRTKAGLEAVNELHDCMCSCVQLRVPIETEPGIGSNWYLAGEKVGKFTYDRMCRRLGVC